MASTGATSYCDARQEFFALYPNRARHIYKTPRDAKWKSLSVRLATGVIDAAVSCQCDTFYGAYFADLTRFAVIDIDEESQYHSVQELQRLRTNLAAVGLAGFALYQSSRSTGWHLYIPFTEWVSSHEVETALKACLRLLGYEIKGGQLEVFPSGQALRLPLQPGFAWLDDSGNVVLQREKLGQGDAVSLFLSDLKNNANDWAIAKTIIQSQLDAGAAGAGSDAQAREDRLATAGLEDLFSAGKIQANWDRGREFWRDGLSGRGQRHDALLFVGHYLWYGDSENGIAALPGFRNDEYRAELIEEWLTRKHNGYCRHIDTNKWDEVRTDIKRAVLWRVQGEKPEYEPYRLTERLLKRLLAIYRKTGKVWTVEEFQRANEDRRDEARNKVRSAVSYCLAEGVQISRKTLQALTGCSPNTLRKHGDLWRLLAAGSGEYSSGGLAVLGSPCSEKGFLTPSLDSVTGDFELDQEVQLSGEVEAVSTPTEPVACDQAFSSDSVLVRWFSGGEVPITSEERVLTTSRGYQSAAQSKNAAPRALQLVYGTDLRWTYAHAKQLPELQEPAAVYSLTADTGD